MPPVAPVQTSPRGDIALAPETLAAHARPGPRYTSYPPATEFRPAFGGADAGSRLQTLAATSPAAPISLYCHIPYCSRLCWYCGCNVTVTRDRSRGSSYVDVLIEEIDLVAGILGRGWPLAELALGGGSPNFLAGDDLRRLHRAIGDAFTVQPDADLGIELDPRDTTLDKVELLAELGFRRFSVGVQDFAEEVQRRINRYQTAEQTADLLAAARRSGFTSANVDLVYGLPEQTPERFADTLDQVIAMAPQQVAIFGYAHLPHLRRHQKLVEREGPVPGPSARAELLLLALERFGAAGYQRIGLDHFARPDAPLAVAARAGKLQRNFQGYVVDRAEHMVACGTTGISDVAGAYWQNLGDDQDWAERVHAGELPVARGIALGDDDLLRRWVIRRLMCDGVLDFAAVDARSGGRFEDDFAGELGRLEGDDLAPLATVDRDARRITATPLGQALIRNVCMVFDRYLTEPVPGAPRFSPTL